MLLSFQVENYRSFQEVQELSLIPDEGKQGHPKHIFEVNEKYQMLRSAVIYGANASGKSNLMKAFQSLRNIIINSANNQHGELIPVYEPFKFFRSTNNLPTRFIIDFLLEKVRYHYEVAFLSKSIVEEKLLFYPEGREASLFKRVEQKFSFGDYLKGKKSTVADLTTPNQLFISKAAQNNIKQLVKVFQYFVRDFMPIPYLDNWVDSYYLGRIAKDLLKKKNEIFFQNFKQLISSFNTGVLDFRIETIPVFEDQEFEFFVKHQQYDIERHKIGEIELPLAEESTGTQKLFVIGALILRALMNGRVIIIDEFERSLHPMITSYLLDLFHNPEINSRGAQLIIATHDTNILTSTPLRRDQIWIIEKDRLGMSELLSLADISGVRSDIPFEKWYLSGRFGGVPSIKSLNFEIAFENEKE